MAVLEGRSIVVSGGADGIGLACVTEFARQGASVTVGDLKQPDQPKLDELTDMSGTVRFVECDVTDSAQVKALADGAAAAFGGIQSVFSNAGIEGNGTVETCTEESWDHVLAVNLKGMFLMGKHCVPYLRAAGGGAILNMASVSAFWGEPNTVAYNASKGGIVGLTRAMAMDYGPDNIRVNCLAPGFHDTGMVQRFFADLRGGDELINRVNSLMAVRRIGRPEELARLAAFMLSDENGYITGAAMVLDGGMTAGYPWPE
jgi:NAD(P)-dependent dehydrogenase (short-subunit alcohol dehydrogenase family)